MKKVAYKWYDPQPDTKVRTSTHAMTGLKPIPGCEKTCSNKDNIPTVLFNKKRYRAYSIGGPFGIIALGNEGTYDQELSGEKLFPITKQPIIVPFGEHLTVHG